MVDAQRLNDTIAAIATPLARSALGIIRVSGKDSIDIVDSISHRTKKPYSLKKFKPNVVYRVKVGYSADDLIDDCTVIVYRAPRSYTGEDMVELICHGNPLILKTVLELLIERGARLAEPGEFTMRAMLNGKLELDQALAVADIVDSPTLLGVKTSVKRLAGGTESNLRRLKERLLWWLTWLEAWVDFPEEEIPEPELQQLLEELDEILESLNRILQASKLGRILREGCKTVITGKPNVGKSTLFNYLVGEDRAITSSMPGTTRDVITEYVNILGIPLKLYDTAGLRTTGDPIERIGTQKARDALKEAELVLVVIDVTQPLSEQVDETMRCFSTLNLSYQKVVIAVNKVDLISKSDLDRYLEELRSKLCSEFNYQLIPISLKTGYNLENLLKAIRDTLIYDEALLDEVVFTSAFAQDSLTRALNHLQALRNYLTEGYTLDIALHEFKLGLNAISKLLGEELGDDVLEGVFSRFCIGK